MGNTNDTINNPFPLETPTLNSSAYSSSSLSPKPNPSIDTQLVLSITTTNSTNSASTPKTPKSKSLREKFKFTPLSKKAKDHKSTPTFDDDNKETKEYQPEPRKLVSIKIIEIAADFWNLQVNALTFEEQLVEFYIVKMNTFGFVHHQSIYWSVYGSVYI